MTGGKIIRILAIGFALPIFNFAERAAGIGCLPQAKGDQRQNQGNSARIGPENHLRVITQIHQAILSRNNKAAKRRNLISVLVRRRTRDRKSRIKPAMQNSSGM